MRRIITLALLLALVVGGLATVAIADAGTTAASPIEADAQAQYDSAHEHGDDSEDGSAGPSEREQSADSADLRVTAYEIEDRTIRPDDPLELTTTLQGEGEDPASEDLVLTIDGERHQLGTLTAAPEDERVDFEPNPDSEAESVDVDCEVGINDDDEFYLECTIEIEWPWSDDDGANDGSNDVDVGVADLEPTTVTIEETDGSDDDFDLSEYEIEERTIDADDSLDMTTTFTGAPNGTASEDLVLTVDGDRHRLGTLTTDGERVDFEPNPDSEAESVDVDCEAGYNEEDGFYVKCTIEIEWPWSDDGANDGSNDVDVGAGDLEPTTVTVLHDDSGGDLRVVDYDLEERTIDQSDPVQATLHLEGTGNTTLVSTVDGGRHDIAEITVSDDGSDVDARAVDTAALPGIEIDCEIDMDGIECEIIIGAAAGLDPGDHDVGFGDQDPTTVTVTAEDDLSVVDFDLEERTIDQGDPIELTATLEGTGSTTLVSTVDGGRHDIAEITVSDDGSDVVVEEAETASDIDVVITCYLEDGEVWCEITIEVSSLSAGDHDVGVGGLDPATVTVLDDGDTDDDLELVDYELRDDRIRSDEPFELTATYEGTGDDTASEALVVTVDGERHRLGTLATSPEAGLVEFDENPTSEAESVDVDCEAGYNEEDGYYVKCTITIEWPWSDDDGGVDDGDHGVGVDDMPATTLTVIDGSDDELGTGPVVAVVGLLTAGLVGAACARRFA